MKEVRGITICRPAKARQQGQSRYKIIKKQDFISQHTIHQQTPVDIAMKRMRLQKEIELVQEALCQS